MFLYTHGATAKKSILCVFLPSTLLKDCDQFLSLFLLHILALKQCLSPSPLPWKKKKRKRQNKTGRTPLLLLTPKNIIMKQKLCSSVQFDVFFMLPQWWPNNWLFTCVLVSPDSSTDALNNAPKTAFSRGKSSLIIPGWQHKGTPASGAGTKQGLLGVRIKKADQFKSWE